MFISLIHHIIHIGFDTAKLQKTFHVPIPYMYYLYTTFYTISDSCYIYANKYGSTRVCRAFSISVKVTLHHFTYPMFSLHMS